MINLLCDFDNEKTGLMSGHGFAYSSWFAPFEVDLWKNLCGIGHCILRVEGKGLSKIKLIHLSKDGQKSIILDKETDLSIAFLFKVDLKDYLDGLLILESIPVSGIATLKRVCWYTDEAVKNKVKLGIVVTHFNRKKFVVPAIKRLSEEVVSKYEDIALIVVDNSQTISKEEACGAVIIPNENYGGSGGFTRGLLHLKESGFSHCLFMDDDATCETESILRTYRIFQNIKDPSYAISGSLFNELDPNILIDKGAKFINGRWGPINHDISLSSAGIEKLIRGEEKSNYGGWWFFGFNIDYIKHFPFPTFVRGDDVLFSLDNDFKVLTPFGINCWGDSFFLKEGPIQQYLDLRSILLLNFVSKKGSIYYGLLVVVARFFKMLFTFHYESCLAYIKAIENFMKGPQFYRVNLNAGEIFKEISQFTINEKMNSLSIEQSLLEEKVHPTGWIKLLKLTLVIITCNGLLVPDILLKNKILKQDKSKMISVLNALFYKKIYYYNPLNEQGIILELDKARTIKLLAQFVIVMLRLVTNIPSLFIKYREAHNVFTSEKFWKDVYKLGN